MRELGGKRREISQVEEFTGMYLWEVRRMELINTHISDKIYELCGKKGYTHRKAFRIERR